MAVIEINSDNFETEILKQEGVAMVDFWATWCNPCMMLSPLVDEVAEEVTDVKIGKINVDKEGALAAKFGVLSIPTLIVFKDGQEVRRSTGFIEKEDILDLIKG